jgi:hypothetical protein
VRARAARLHPVGIQHACWQQSRCSSHGDQPTGRDGDQPTGRGDPHDSSSPDPESHKSGRAASARALGCERASWSAGSTSTAGHKPASDLPRSSSAEAMARAAGATRHADDAVGDLAFLISARWLLIFLSVILSPGRWRSARPGGSAGSSAKLHPRICLSRSRRPRRELRPDGTRAPQRPERARCLRVPEAQHAVEAHHTVTPPPMTMVPSDDRVASARKAARCRGLVVLRDIPYRIK